MTLLFVIWPCFGAFDARSGCTRTSWSARRLWAVRRRRLWRLGCSILMATSIFEDPWNTNVLFISLSSHAAHVCLVSSFCLSGFSTVQREKWVHVGAGQGSYSKTGPHVMSAAICCQVYRSHFCWCCRCCRQVLQDSFNLWNADWASVKPPAKLLVPQIRSEWGPTRCCLSGRGMGPTRKNTSSITSVWSCKVVGLSTWSKAICTAWESKNQIMQAAEWRRFWV